MSPNEEKSSYIYTQRWWWNEVNLMNGLQDIDCPSLKPETVETEATTVEVKIDLRGLEYLLI